MKLVVGCFYCWKMWEKIIVSLNSTQILIDAGKLLYSRYISTVKMYIERKMIRLKCFRVFILKDKIAKGNSNGET